jgi:hypothetical protein
MYFFFIFSLYSLIQKQYKLYIIKKKEQYLTQVPHVLKVADDFRVLPLTSHQNSFRAIVAFCVPALPSSPDLS